MLKVVLVAPEIPQNTGAIGRLCVCTGTPLHLIEPLGFSLDESYVRRAGMDYWKHVDLHVHRHWEAFLRSETPERLVFSSTHARKSLYDIRFAGDECLVFGRESSGLPPAFYTRYDQQLYGIPMPGRHARSHNLANAVSIVLYEALRQTAFAPQPDGPTGESCPGTGSGSGQGVHA
jgi:tRNA (cytidine/uridine-2'-O-)-methyltransferase